MKRCKLLYFWLILFSHFGNAQQVVEAAPELVAVEEYVEDEDSVKPTPTREERGETFYRQRNLDPKFKDNYKGKAFDYDRPDPEKSEKEKSLPFFSLPAGLMQVLMYGLLGAIILVVVYFIIKNAGGFSFGTEKKKIKYDTSQETGEEDLENIENNNFQSLIQKAKSEEDFRRAVRYYYLWVLQKLTDKNLIQWNKDKTDYDYLVELGQHSIKEDFSNNTYIYDYTWYGNFYLTSEEFALAESIFQRTLSKLN